MEINSNTINVAANPGEVLDKPSRILIAAAVEAEQAALLRGLDSAACIDVITIGVGSAVAAANTAAALASGNYKLVISAGIGGGFVGQADIGSVVVADAIIAADLGAESPNGFISLDELGFGSARADVSEEWNERLFMFMKEAGLSVRYGTVLTVSTVTGTAATAAARLAAIPTAAAEGMEGYGVATAAQLRGIPVVEIRTISNPVGPRDRTAWRIGEALAALEKVGTAIRSSLGGN